MARTSTLVLLVAVLAGPASAEPSIEIAADVSGAVPIGQVKRTSDMSDRVSIGGLVGARAAYLLSPRFAVGAYVEYGIADAHDTPCLGCGYTIESEARLMRFGIEGTRRSGSMVLGLGIGYELMYVTYTWLDQSNAFRWRGFELLRPSVGWVAYQHGDVAVVPYASMSIAMFDQEQRNGSEHWIAREMSREGDNPGMALHAWLSIGARITFVPRL